MTGEGSRPSSFAASHGGLESADPAAMVECLHVEKAHGPGPSVFHDMSVRILRGDFVCVGGPGGAGKTTFLNLLLGVERPDSGLVLVEGHNVHALGERNLARLRQRIGVVFQDLRLAPGRTVFDNVAFPLFARLKGEALIRQRVGRTLAALRLEEKTTVACERLSQSERQRAAIARALAHGPGLILADEPIAHLDDRDTALVVELLKQAHMAGTTVVVTSHDTGRAFGGAACITLEIRDRRILERARAN